MALRIFKYHVMHGADVVIPAEAVFMKAGVQYDNMYVWAMVDTDTDAPRYTHRFHVLPTGYAEVPDGLEYIDTVFFGNSLVWHIFVEVLPNG